MPDWRKTSANAAWRRSIAADHARIRRDWAPRVATGTIACARCGHLIAPDTPWQLGHDDDRPGHYAGPEHASCGHEAGSRKGGQFSKVWPSTKRPPEKHPGMR